MRKVKRSQKRRWMCLRVESSSNAWRILPTAVVCTAMPAIISQVLLHGGILCCFGWDTTIMPSDVGLWGASRVNSSCMGGGALACLAHAECNHVPELVDHGLGLVSGLWNVKCVILGFSMSEVSHVAQVYIDPSVPCLCLDHACPSSRPRSCLLERDKGWEPRSWMRASKEWMEGWWWPMRTSLSSKRCPLLSNYNVCVVLSLELVVLQVPAASYSIGLLMLSHYLLSL